MDMYQKYYDYVMQQIDKKGIGVLATSAQDMPSTRMMSFVIYDGKIAFQTSYKLHKFEQIEQNKRVSLCFSNINITGTAQIDHRQALENQQFIAHFEKKHHNSFIAYSSMQSTRVVEIILEKVVIWEYKAGEPYRVFLDIVNKTCYHEAYLHTEND